MLRILCLTILCFSASAYALEPRIIGGTRSAENTWTGVVALVERDLSSFKGQFCGGTLVHPRWVLTAGHCTDGETPDTVEVLVGQTDLAGSGGQRVRIQRMVRHPKYSPDTLDYDAALLELSQSVDLQPVKLAETYSLPLVPGELGTILGWGKTSPYGTTYPNTLFQTDVPIVAARICQATYPGEISDAMFCAGYWYGKRDACLGDSGGPFLQLDENGTPVQYGIISWGEGCAQMGYYGVYTNVAKIFDFVTETICTTEPAPLPPHFNLSQDNAYVAMHWNSPYAPQGYRLYYAPYSYPLGEHTLQHIGSLDMNTQTSFNIWLYPRSHYYLAVRTYQGVCHSDFSNILDVRAP